METSDERGATSDERGPVADATAAARFSTVLLTLFGAVARLVGVEGFAIAAVGGAAGLAAALAATRVLRSLLYGVAPADPATFAAIVGLLTLAAAAANWIPARRAARTDPARVLRGQ